MGEEVFAIDVNPEEAAFLLSELKKQCEGKAKNAYAGERYTRITVYSDEYVRGQEFKAGEGEIPKDILDISNETKPAKAPEPEVMDEPAVEGWDDE